MNKKKRNIQTNSEVNGKDEESKAATDETQEEAYKPSNPIYEAGNHYCVSIGSGGSKEITNFVMRPVSAIQGDDVYLLEIEFTLNGGMKVVRQLNSSAFSSVQKFKSELKRISGLDMTFDGTEADLSHIQNFMNNKYRNYERCTGVSYVGLHKVNGEWVYVGTDGAINRKGEPVTNLVSALEDNSALESKIIGTEVIKCAELCELAPELFRFNTYERTIPIIGWVCVCFFKERLRERQIKMSHLVISGGAGSGKSETLEKIIQPIFCLTGSGIGCKGLTNFSTLKSTSSTNLLPIIYEEYKPYRLNPTEINIVSGLMRNTYDGQSSQRGKADQSVVSYIRRSPVILVGESSFDETAIKERIIDVQLAKSDRTEAHTKCYKSLAKKRKLLNKLGKSLLLMAMSLSDKMLDKLIEQSKVFESLEFESRVTLGISNVRLGIELLKELYTEYHLDFEKLTGITDKLIYDSLVSNTMNAMDGATKVRSAVDLAIQVFDTMAIKGAIWRGRDFVVDKDKMQLYLRINVIYDEFTKYVRIYNITDIEVLSVRQFTKQLRKEKYFLEYAQRDFTKDTNGNTMRKKCYVLDLKQLCESCDLEAFNPENPDDDEGKYRRDALYERMKKEEAEDQEDRLPTDKDGFIDVGALEEQEELPFD